MTYAVTLTREALEDLLRLEDFLIESALRHGDMELPSRAKSAIRTEFRILETNPFTCRIADTDPLERELIVPFGASGYVGLFRVISEREVVVAAIRHLREDDYH
ncbi:putative plasmid stabilization system protein [Variovorax paradoxus B4]|uniref:Putative plasmid stabilization system protein n=1 Tax=Variovorax paradoxus B4 TaxID=1246301 RepID=T1XKT7_VARPD|nr:type II toxin-antitoxin system RelE/ParE family toxin [Variovorax paradoxus]AGU53198.1 putative plasmid stabilization system protein [Variovorax paradoxus B4]